METFISIFLIYAFVGFVLTLAFLSTGRNNKQINQFIGETFFSIGKQLIVAIIILLWPLVLFLFITLIFKSSHEINNSKNYSKDKDDKNTK